MRVEKKFSVRLGFLNFLVHKAHFDFKCLNGFNLVNKTVKKIIESIFIHSFKSSIW